MIRILLIEDELPARKKLKRFLEDLNADTEIAAEIDTVATAIAFLTNNTVDLILSDIELLDGNAFEIYHQVSVSCPIIFTTAYDQFWMDAFESNGIAYLLKPFSKDRFQNAWDKFMLLRHVAPEQNKQLSNLAQLIEKNFSNPTYKRRFAVPTHQGTYFLDIEQIAFFMADESVIFAIDALGKKHLLTVSTLKDLEAQLNPSDFFRINRSELIHKPYVEKIERYSKNTIAINIKGSKTLLKTSQSLTSSFRAWIEK